ncbi:MAG: dihydroxyacetone kinase [Clostridiales bacterium]|nr:MAG: dihydroxyacetone kinase [Clostridiales bacterium]
MFSQSALKLKENKDVVDKLNVFPVPDGDTGTNMSLTMNKAIEDLYLLQEPNLKTLVNTMAKGCLMGARGNSGVILSQIFRGFAKYSENLEVMSIRDFALALDSSAKTAYKAVLKPVEGTILTVIREVAEEAIEVSFDDINFIEFFNIILKKGKESLENTPNLLKPLKDAGVVDSGGMGLLYILSGFSEALEGKSVDLSTFQGLNKLPSEMPAQAHINPNDIKFTYCTEFIVKGEKVRTQSIKETILSMGDSVVYVPDEDALKVHVHTNVPGEVLTEALKLGDIVKTKIDNMRLQHSDIVNSTTEIENKKYGFIAVSLGEGLSEIFASLGVDIVISGGQTMNPSTEDILEATNKINADTIFVLPNNSNIILTATQAAEISNKNIVVVPTKTIPQGISSLIAFNDSVTESENINAFNDQIDLIKSIQITHAVRDTKINDLDIEKGSYIGIVDGNIVKSLNTLLDSAYETIRFSINDDSEFVSIYYGSDVNESEANELLNKLTSEMPNVEFELNYGGQPVYYYIVSVE